MKNTRSISWYVAVLISAFPFSEAAFSEEDLMASSTEVEIRIEEITYTSTKYKYSPKNGLKTFNDVFDDAKKKASEGENFFIDVVVKSELTNAYLEFSTHVVSCNEYTGDCFSFPSGYAIRDNYGNSLNVSAITPIHGTGSAPLRPGEEKKFRFWTKSKPLDGIKFLVFEVPKFGFGNIEELEIKIPASAISKELIGDGHP
jgi:hypothetical protein